MATRGPQPKTVLFSEEAVVAFPAPKAGAPLIYRDEAIKGLILSVSKTGVRSYKTETRTPQGGKNHTHLGYAPADKLDDIRKKAVVELGRKASEQAKTTAQDSGRTMEGVLEAYIRDKGIQPENARKYRQALRTYGWPFWAKSVKHITRDEVLRHRTKVKEGNFPRPPDSKAQGGPGPANRMTEYGSMVVTWLLGRRADNPFKDHIPYATTEPEERYVLEPTDWGRIYQVVQRWDQDDKDLFWLHVLLGARPMGTARLRWDRVLWDQRAYKLTQDRKECQGWKPAQSPAWDYPLDSWSMDILRERKKFADPACPYVFPSPQRRHEGDRRRFYTDMLQARIDAVEADWDEATRCDDEADRTVVCTQDAAKALTDDELEALFARGQQQVLKRQAAAYFAEVRRIQVWPSIGGVAVIIENQDKQRLHLRTDEHGDGLCDERGVELLHPREFSLHAYLPLDTPRARAAARKYTSRVLAAKLNAR